MQEKQTGKKRVAMGMCSKTKSHVHYDKFIANSSVNKTTFVQELYADKNTYLQWYDTYQTVNRFIDGRSYAQVVSCSPPLDVRNKSVVHAVKRVHWDPRCQRLPHGNKGKKGNPTLFALAVTKLLMFLKKVVFLVKKRLLVTMISVTPFH